MTTDLWAKAQLLAETYTLEELFEMNDLEPEDVIFLLLKEEYLNLDTPTIVDLEPNGTRE